MKKLMLLAALLAMLVIAAVPAIAQITEEGEQEAESGDVDQNFTVTSEGDNGNQCANVAGIANTGNAQNQLNLVQYASIADDFEFEDVGANLTVTGAPTVSCTQKVQQAAAAG